MNLTELLDTTAARWPQKPALIEESTVVSYAELVQRTNELAAKLQSLPITIGGRIGLAFPNGISYVALTFALWRVKAVVVPIPTECTEEEMAELSAAMQLEAILSQKSRGESVAVAADCFFTRLHPPAPPDNHGLNLAFIRFTSGTTSARKGVALAHETVRDRVRSANQAFGIGPDDTVIWCLPMAHHFLITIVLYLSVGATVVLARHVLAQPFLEAIQSLERHGALRRAVSLRDAGAGPFGRAPFPSVRLAVSTTCALPQDVAEDFYRRYRLPLVQGLGVIELGLVSLNTDDPRGRWNSVGRPAGDFRVRIHEPGRRRLRRSGRGRAGYLRRLRRPVDSARAACCATAGFSPATSGGWTRTAFCFCSPARPP